MLNEEELIMSLKKEYNKVLAIYKSITKPQDNLDDSKCYLEIIQNLNQLICILNDNFKSLNDKSVKSTTIVLKQDILNYIYSRKVKNAYMIKKYRIRIDKNFDVWSNHVKNYILYKGKNGCEKIGDAIVSFDSIFSYIKTNSVADIISEISSMYKTQPIKISSNFMGGVCSKLSPNTYYDMLCIMKEDYDNYYWVYDKLIDSVSKNVLLNILRYKISMYQVFLDKIPSRNTAFFDEELVKINKDTILLDIDENISCCQDKYKQYINMYRDLNYKNHNVTFIKVNCKENVLEKLKSIKDIIKDNYPSMSICIDNNFTDIFNVPKYLTKINSKYKFYLRYYKISDSISKTVIYAVMN